MTLHGLAFYLVSFFEAASEKYSTTLRVSHTNSVSLSGKEKKAITRNNHQSMDYLTGNNMILNVCNQRLLLL